ncbi:MAG: hypothetical protein AAGA62_14165, partial [Bacteroidota bacterium]
MTLTWTDTNGGTANTIVERRLGGGSWETVATISDGSTSYVPPSLPGGTSASYRLRAESGGVTSSSTGEQGQNAEREVRYAVIDLGLGIPMALNNKGHVVGHDQGAFVWESGIRTTLKAALPSAGPGSATEVTDINDDGRIVGAAYYDFPSSIPDDPPFRLLAAAYWSSKMASPSNLGIYSVGDDYEIYNGSNAQAINTKGRIVGTSHISYTGGVAAKFTGGSVVKLGPNGFASSSGAEVASYANDVNSSGRWAGYVVRETSDFNPPFDFSFLAVRGRAVVGT